MGSDKTRRNRAVSAVINNARRASKPVRRHSRDVIDTAVAQLFDALAAPPIDHDAGSSGQYRMEELAGLAGTTTRNIRLYRDRGLLDPPQRLGRLAIYNDSHLQRLSLINQLLRRGYTIANVRELLTAYQAGHSLGDVLGLSEAPVAAGAWAPESPERVPLNTAQDLIADPPAFERLIALDLLRIDGETATVMRPKLLNTFTEIRARGVTLDRLLDIHEHVLPHINSISDELVRAGAEYAAAVVNPGNQPTDDAEFAELVSTLIAFGPQAVSAINGTLTACIQDAAAQVVQRMLADFVQRSAHPRAEPHLPGAVNPTPEGRET